MLVKLQNKIINTDFIVSAEWNTGNPGTASEYQSLQIRMSFPVSHGPSLDAYLLNFKDDEETRQFWDFLESKCEWTLTPSGGQAF